MFLPDDKRPTSDGYSCIVIGSGPAGVTLTLELDAAKRRVLLLESGPGDGDLASAIGYGHFAGDYWNAHWIRAFGGTSNAWGGWLATLRPIDFDHPTIGIKWPITHADVLPYYRRAANILNRHRVVANFEQPLMDGWIYRPFSLEHPTRFGERYRSTLSRSTFVDVAIGYSAVGFDATDSRSSITGIRCFDHRTKTTFTLPVQPSQAVVVACGGMGNAQLLLQPQDDGSAPIGNESGHVGKFLMEHPHAIGAGECVMDLDTARLTRPAEFGDFTDVIVLDPALEAEHQRYGCSLQLVRAVRNEELVAAVAMAGQTLYQYRISARSEMRPTAANRVYLTREQSRSGLYRVAARCVIDAEDLVNIDRTLRMFGDSLVTLKRGRVRVNNDVLYREVTGGGHTMGTTRMGSGRSTSVVDGDCRVHGYGNFFVAGSSVFATGGYANPTFTIVALAMRLGDLLAKRV
jgi:choline dehydrogenase-like flavoprotein